MQTFYYLFHNILSFLQILPFYCYCFPLSTFTTHFNILINKRTYTHTNTHVLKNVCKVQFFSFILYEDSLLFFFLSFLFYFIVVIIVAIIVVVVVVIVFVFIITLRCFVFTLISMWKMKKKNILVFPFQVL